MHSLCCRIDGYSDLHQGAGVSPQDVTPEALEEIRDRRIPGIGEAFRSYRQQRTPYWMLSRSIAGLIVDTVVLGFLAQIKGATESMVLFFPLYFTYSKSWKVEGTISSFKILLKKAAQIVFWAAFSVLGLWKLKTNH